MCPIEHDWHNQVLRWCGTLLQHIHHILHAYVWRQHDVDDNDITTNNITTMTNHSNNHSNEHDDSRSFLDETHIDHSSSFSATMATATGAATASNGTTAPGVTTTTAGVTTTKATISNRSRKHHDQVLSALFLLGELMMLGFSVEEDEARALPLWGTGGTTGGAKGSSTGGSGGSTMTPLPPLPLQYTVSEVTRSFKLVLPGPLLALAQLLMDHTLPQSVNIHNNATTTNSRSTANSTSGSSSSSSSNNNSNLHPATASGIITPIPDVIRAYAFVTIGKFCLRDKSLARNHINLFLRELTQSSSQTTSASAASGDWFL